MVFRHKSKSGKYLGSRRWGHGAGKRVRGKGGRGGVGRAGVRGHRFFWKLQTEGNKGEKGFVPIRKKDFIEIDLNQLSQQLSKGKWPKQGDAFEVDYSKQRVKVLGSGKLSEKVFVKAHAFSKKAVEKISAAGGKAVPLQAKKE